RGGPRPGGGRDGRDGATAEASTQLRSASHTRAQRPPSTSQPFPALRQIQAPRPSHSYRLSVRFLVFVVIIVLSIEEFTEVVIYFFELPPELVVLDLEIVLGAPHVQPPFGHPSSIESEKAPSGSETRSLATNPDDAFPPSGPRRIGSGERVGHVGV